MTSTVMPKKTDCLPKDNTPRKKRGRPSKYNTINLEQVERVAGLGFDDVEIATILGISERTLNVYKSKPEFLQSLKRGKALVDHDVTRNLFKRAIGYSYEEKTKERKGDKVMLTKIVTKEVVPDVTAQIFWLKNRRKDLWRERQEIDLTLKEYKHVEYKHFTKEQLDAETERLADEILASRGRTSIPKEGQPS